MWSWSGCTFPNGVGGGMLRSNLEYGRGMSMDKVRLAIVGCGTISQLNAPGYLMHEGCEVTALCDPLAERAEERAGEWGIEPHIHTSYEDVLNDANVDAVELLTPTFLHAEQIIAGLEAGKHVSCQKPVAVDVAEMGEIVAAVERSDTFFRTTENFLYYPPIVKARELIRDGALGDVSMVRIRTVRGSVEGAVLPIMEGAYTWRLDPARNAGGMLYDDGWHKVATAIWWGGGVERVSAHVTRGDNFMNEMPSVATWKYAGVDRLAVIEYAGASEMPMRTRYYPADEFMEVIGSKGVLWVTRCTGEMLDMPPVVLHLGDESVSYHLSMDWIEGFNGAAADFVDGILEGRQPMMDVRFSEEVLRAILAMYRSSDSGVWVAPGEVE